MVTSIFSSAKYINDVEDNYDFVQIEYERYVPEKREYETFVDNFCTVPLCDWVELTSNNRNVPYENFLNSMVAKSTEIYQRLCCLIVENINMGSPSNKQLMRTVRSLKIIDPSFEPPYFNMKSDWQRELMERMCKDTLPDAIESCISCRRLEKLFNVLKLIESELR